jgi:solute carrier family 13 (sodium-dependent dicarboxylate transporter), member 2/3/5
MALEGWAMTKCDVTVAPIAMTPSNAPKPQDLLTPRTLIGAVLGPIVGLLVWWLPLGLDPPAQHALAIVAFMLVYWIAEPIEQGMTALIGCFCFWVLHITTSEVAFSGFTNTTPWFVFGALLMGEAAAQTGLAKRLGYTVMDRVGTSYSRLLLGSVLLAYLLNFLIPSPNAQLVILASLLTGIVAMVGVERHSTLAKGLFVTVTYACTLFGKMNLSAASTLLARGMIEEQTGTPVLWSYWLLAFLPAAVLTIATCWLTARWLYPAKTSDLPGSQQYLREAVQAMGPWSRDEQKALGWLLLAITLWATDFWHHTDPAAIALGISLLLVLPKVGVLDTKAIKSVNFLLIIFISGAMSMGTVLTETQAINVLADRLMQWIAPLLSNEWHAAFTLYWGGFLYHFLLVEDKVMVSTALPILLKFGTVHGYNPMALGMIWSFTTGGKLLVYQSSVLILGYSYGYFEGKDLLKVGAILTVVESLVLMVLVSVYWPLIGLHWMAP